MGEIGQVPAPRSRAHDYLSGAERNLAGVSKATRFGSALNLNVHFHVLFADSVSVETGGDAEFCYLGKPSRQELEGILEQILKRVAKPLEKESDQESFDSDLSDLNKLSISMTEGYGENRGKKQIRYGVPPQEDRELLPTQAVKFNGYSLHAGVSAYEASSRRLI